MIKTVPIQAIKGRGAATAVAHRFERLGREAFDDGWGEGGANGALEAGEQDGAQGRTTDSAQSSQPPRPVPTQVHFEDAKSVLSRNSSPDIYFEQSVNPYRGCEHGCVYCYARPTHSYLGWSPGLDFETQIIAKRNVAAVLRRELARPSYVARPLAIGVNTDCYQPVERELRLTRGVIETLSASQHAFALITKSSLVERDLDLLVPMAAQQRAAVYVTVTTLDARLARVLEPRAAAPYRRLQTIRRLTEAGVPVGVSVAPQIPFITDDLEHVLQAAWDAGARRAFYTVLRLPWELKEVFAEWLALHYPQRAARVMARVHDMRGGKDYDSDFATRMRGSGPWAELLRQRFDKASAKLGYSRDRHPLDYSAFKVPQAWLEELARGGKVGIGQQVDLF